jgi:hypothetical protein
VASAFILGVIGVFPAILAAIIAVAFARLSLLAVQLSLGDRSARVELSLLGDDEENDFAPPKHRLIIVFDTCWIIGVAITVHEQLPWAGATAAGIAAAVTFHALCRSRFFILVPLTALLIPAIVGGIAAVASEILAHLR